MTRSSRSAEDGRRVGAADHHPEDVDLEDDRADRAGHAAVDTSGTPSIGLHLRAVVVVAKGKAVATGHGGGGIEPVGERVDLVRRCERPAGHDHPGRAERRDPGRRPARSPRDRSASPSCASSPPGARHPRRPGARHPGRRPGRRRSRRPGSRSPRWPRASGGRGSAPPARDGSCRGTCRAGRQGAWTRSFPFSRRQGPGVIGPRGGP